MKEIRKLVIRTVMTITIILLFIACETEEPEGFSYPPGPELPNELMPNETKTDISNEWRGKYKCEAINGELQLTKFQTSNTNSSAFFIMFRNPSIKAATFHVVEVSGKIIKAEVFQINSSPWEVSYDVIYTLCTDYTINGSSSGAVLTFFGGNVPGVSDQIWVLE